MYMAINISTIPRNITGNPPPTHKVYSPKDARAFLRNARRSNTLVRQAVPEAVAVWAVDSQVLTSVRTYFHTQVCIAWAWAGWATA